MTASAPLRLGALALFAAAACATARPAAEASSEQQNGPPLDEFFQTRRYGTAISLGMSFSHDDKLAAFQSDAGGRLDIWVKPLDGGPGRQVTHVEGFVGNFAFSPTDDVLAYEADVGGDELPHLFLTDSNGSAPRDLTADYPKGRRTQFIEWAPDGRTFLYLSNLRDEKLMDLYEYDLASGRSQLVWEASGALSFGVADREHKRFALVETLSDKNSNLYLVERSGSPVLLTPHDGDVLYSPQDFTRDGALLFTSDQGSEFTGLYSMDLASKGATPVLQPSWDVDTAGESLKHRYRVVAVNADGTEQISLRDLASGADVKVQPAPLGGGWLPSAFSPRERWLGVWLRTDAVPQTPYAIDLQTGQARKLDEPLPATLRNYPMVVGQAVRIPSFDGRPVPAFFYKPQGKGPFPAVIDVHGGPTSQSRRTFNPFRQYLVSRGIAVLVPNVRGSTGYGKTWAALDDRDLGGGPLKDVVACKWWMVGNEGVADDKVVVMGGSYGGYMALAAEAFASDEFAANVDFFGVSDLKTLVESFPPYWASAATYIYEKFGNPGDPKDAQYQHDRSPIHFTDRMKQPLLVVQGDKDVRVRKEQSDRIVEALRKRNVPVYYLVLENEGHGFSRNDDMLRAYEAADRFLRKYVLGDASVKVLP